MNTIKSILTILTLSFLGLYNSQASTPSTLVADTQIPLIMDGKTVGTMTLKAHSPIVIREIKCDTVIVSRNAEPTDTTFTLPISAVDPESVLKANEVIAKAKEAVVEAAAKAQAVATASAEAETTEHNKSAKIAKAQSKLEANLQTNERQLINGVLPEDFIRYIKSNNINQNNIRSIYVHSRDTRIGALPILKTIPSSLWANKKLHLHSVEFIPQPDGKLRIMYIVRNEGIENVPALEKNEITPESLEEANKILTENIGFVVISVRDNKPNSKPLEVTLKEGKIVRLCEIKINAGIKGKTEISYGTMYGDTHHIDNTSSNDITADSLILALINLAN